MQPVEAHKGLSTRSQLVDSLKVYLNNKNRLQPIIGLGSIIECVNADTHDREALYLCEVCACRLSKADMRNHIMGSLHRYSYIKAWHPHLVSEWKESDLSKLAWPLMEKAKTLEGQEGPGDVQLLEVGDAVYQKMATHSENYAIALITILRDGQGYGEPKTTFVKLEQDPVQSQRIVLPPQNEHRGSKKSLRNTSPNEESENGSSSSFFDDYVGTQPLIGLYRMVECRDEDGHTYCFLCHCCRIRCNSKDIIDHLTRSSHLVNYLMEIYPEQAAVEGSYRLLQPLAKKVEREEGRGKPEVVNAPESLCIQLTGKSYHWCINKLSIGLTHTNQKWKKPVKGPSVNKAWSRCVPEKCAVVPSPRANRKTAKRKLTEETNTVFRVSLPITKGSVLLERTSVGVESTAYSPQSDSERTPSPEFQAEDCELDNDSAFNCAEETSQPQQDFYSGDADAGQHTGQEGNITYVQTQYQEADFNDNEHMNQWEDRTGKKYQKVYRDDNCEGYYDSQERSSKKIYKERPNEGPQTQSEWPAGSHTHNWPNYYSFYGHEAGRSEQRYSSASQNQFGVSREESQNKMLAQHYYQQQNQYMTQEHTSLQRGGMGQYESAAHSDAARNEFAAYGGGVTSEQRARVLEVEHRRLQTYMEFPIDHVHTAQRSYMTPPVGYQDFQVGHGMMSNPGYNTGPGPNSDQYCPHPAGGGGGGGGFSQSNAFISPEQALPYGAHSGYSYRAAGWSDLTSSGRSDGTTPYMNAYPNFHSAYIAAPQ